MDLGSFYTKWVLKRNLHLSDPHNLRFRILIEIQVEFNYD